MRNHEGWGRGTGAALRKPVLFVSGLRHEGPAVVPAGGETAVRSLDISPKLWPPLGQEDIKVSNVLFNLHGLPSEMQSWRSGEHLTHPGK